MRYILALLFLGTLHANDFGKAKDEYAAALKAAEVEYIANLRKARQTAQRKRDGATIAAIDEILTPLTAPLRGRWSTHNLATRKRRYYTFDQSGELVEYKDGGRKIPAKMAKAGNKITITARDAIIIWTLQKGKWHVKRWNSLADYFKGHKPALETIPRKIS